MSWRGVSSMQTTGKAEHMVRRHPWGIVNAIVPGVGNGLAEGINSRIRLVKIRSHGFRSEERFRDVVYFHLGGLDLYPAGMPSDG